MRCIYMHMHAVSCWLELSNPNHFIPEVFSKKISGFPLKVRYIHSLDRDTTVSLQVDDDVQWTKETIKAAGRKALQRFLNKICAEVSQMGENDKSGGAAWL